MTALQRMPSRGEVWLAKLPSDPPEKGRRLVVIVSSEARNRHVRADTVLVAPLSTSMHEADNPTHLLLNRGETGLQEDSIVRAEDITTVLKASLVEPRVGLQTISDRRICQLAVMVRIAMGC